MTQITEYFSMQGRVYIGIRNADGTRDPAKWVYDASVLEVSQTKDREERTESHSGDRGVAATMGGKRSLTFNLTLGQLNSDIAALAMDGVRVEVVGGSVVAEAIGDVEAGSVVALDYAATSNHALVDGTAAPLVLDTDYTVDEALGVLTFLSTKAGVTDDYDYAAHSLVTLGNSANQDHYLVFAGLNTVDGATQRCRGELYNLTLNPSETFGFIQDTFGDLSMSGIGKIDTVRQSDPKFGPYGRLHLIQPAA